MKPLGASDPQTIGSYQLLGVLGSGGMGRVYLGQSRTGRRVAIKVIRPDLAEDPVFRDRFTREVAAARLVSPLFTAGVVDADTTADAPWLATTFIEGIGLDRRVLDQGPMAAEEVLSLAAGLGEALTSIHGVGLVHRDLKPSNILLNSSGPHIIDFGLALGTEQSRLTTSLVVGTPSYMAPERLRGDDAGPPSDIFSLGATLVFAATGRDLVDDATVYQQVLQIAEGRFNLADVPPRLRAIIVRCVSFEPRDRPTSAELTRFVIALGAIRPSGDTTEFAGPAAAWPAGDDTGSGDFAAPAQPAASPQSPLPRRTPESPQPRRTPESPQPQGTPESPAPRRTTPLVLRPHTTPPDSGRWRGPSTDPDHAITPSGVSVTPVEEEPRWTRRRLLVGGGVLGGAVAVGAIVLAVDALAHQQTGSGVSTDGPSTNAGQGAPTGSPGVGQPSIQPTRGKLLGQARSGGRYAVVTPAGLVVSARPTAVVAERVGGGSGWTHPTRAGTGVGLWRWGDDILVVDGKTLSLLDGASGRVLQSAVPADLAPVALLPRQRAALALTLGLAIAVDDQRAYVSLGPALVALDRQLKPLWWKKMQRAGVFFEVPTGAGGGFLVTQLASPLANGNRLRSATTGEIVWTEELGPGAGLTPGQGTGGPGPGGGTGGGGGPGQGPPDDPATTGAEACVTANWAAVRIGPVLHVFAAGRQQPTLSQTWPTPISAMEIIDNSLVVASGQLSLYNLATAQPVWQHAGAGGRLGAVASPSLIVLADTQQVAGVEPKTGNPKWTVPLPAGTVGATPIAITTGPHAIYVSYGPRPDGKMPDDDVVVVAV